MSDTIEKRGADLILKGIGITCHIIGNMVCYQKDKGLSKLTELCKNADYLDEFTGDWHYFVVKKDMLIATENSDGTIKYQVILDVQEDKNSYTCRILPERDLMSLLGDNLVSRVRQAIFEQAKIL